MTTEKPGAKLDEAPMRCPNCGEACMHTSRQDAEAGDLELVTCQRCGYKTDRYEAMKQAELEPDRKPPEFPETASLTGSFRVEGRGLVERAEASAAWGCAYPDCGCHGRAKKEVRPSCPSVVIPELLQEIERQGKLLADYRTVVGALEIVNWCEAGYGATFTAKLGGVARPDAIAAHRRIVAAEKERG